nr:DNA cytosine methyltransferase [uncultured Arsenicibacter sp.]
MNFQNYDSKFIGIELYAGPGGMSLGAHLAGVNVKLAVEINKATSLTYKENHKSTTIINDDVANIDNLPAFPKEKIKILFGGPPCQGFSLSNKRTRNLENAKNWQFKNFIRLAEKWHPDWLVIENVSGLLTTEKGIFLEMILQDLHKIGYTTYYKVLNAVNFGIPQKRERLFIVASKHNQAFEFPDPTGSFVTVKDAINDLPFVENGCKSNELEYAGPALSSYSLLLREGESIAKNNGVTKNGELIIERYKHIQQGNNWSSIPDHLMHNYKDKNRCHAGIYYRLKENEPSVVIGNYRKNMLIHPTFNRGLSVREAARLQSFPDWFEFKGFLTDQQQQVGDAVPPLLAKQIFHKILSY